MKNVIQLGLIAALLCTTYTPSSFAGGGGLNGGGGDGVYCKPSSLNNFRGRYTLDYLVAVNNTSFPMAALPRTTEQAIGKLIGKFEQTVPDLANSLKYFWSRYKKPLIDSSRKNGNAYRWVSSKLPPINIKDENLMEELPVNCRDHVFQMVIREPVSSNSFLFRYSQIVIDQTIQSFNVNHKASGAIQETMLVTHEWLRDFTDDAKIIRDINTFLFSQYFDQLGEEDIVANLVELRLAEKLRTKTQYDADLAALQARAARRAELKAEVSRLAQGRPAIESLRTREDALKYIYSVQAEHSFYCKHFYEIIEEDESYFMSTYERECGTVYRMLERRSNQILLDKFPQ